MTHTVLGNLAATSYAATLGIPNCHTVSFAPQPATFEAAPDMVSVEGAPKWMSYEPGTGERSAARFADNAVTKAAIDKNTPASEPITRAAAITLAMAAAGCDSSNKAEFNSLSAMGVILAVSTVFALGLWIGRFTSNQEVEGGKVENGDVDVGLGSIELDTSDLEKYEAAFLSRFMDSDTSVMDLRAELDDFLTLHPKQTPAFFDAIEKFAEEYAERSWSLKCKTDFADEVMMNRYSRHLSVLINEPRLLANPGIDRTLEALATVGRAESVPSVSFVTWNNDGGECVLNENVNFDLVKAVERIAKNHRIWKNVFGRRFMASLTHVTQIFSKIDSGRTLPARLALLDGVRYLSRSADNAKILNNLVYTFESHDERLLLTAVADSNSDFHDKTRKVASRILGRDF